MTDRTAITQLRAATEQYLPPRQDDFFSGGIFLNSDFMPQDILVWRSFPTLNVTATSMHHRMILKIILDGSCTMLLDGIRIRMKQGDMILIFPYQFHSTTLECPRNQYSFLAITFTEKNHDYSPFLTLKNCLLRPDSADTENLETLVRASRSKEADAPETCTFALLKILLNQRRKKRLDVHDACKGDDLFDRVCRHIREHFTEGISLKTLAAEFHVTPETIRRCFLQAHAGITPGKLILRLRIQLAAELLSHTGEKTFRIARQCGYPDQFAFSRAFKSAMGMSPALYRKR